jgi:hypothetical protein
LEELVSGLLRPKLFPFGKLSKAKPAAHLCTFKGTATVCVTYFD